MTLEPLCDTAFIAAIYVDSPQTLRYPRNKMFVILNIVPRPRDLHPHEVCRLAFRLSQAPYTFPRMRTRAQLASSIDLY